MSIRQRRNRRWSHLVLRGSPVSVTVAGMLLIAALATCPEHGSRADSGAHAITNARIITVTGGVIEQGSVVMRDGLIIAVGANVKIPADARVIDGKGLNVYPGLIDGYTNLGLAAPAAAAPAQGQAGQVRTPAQPGPPAAAQQPPSAEQSHGDPSASAADQLRPGGSAIEDARSVGITTALTAPRQGIFAGQSALINLAGLEAPRMVVRTPVALTVQFSSGGGFGGGYPGSLMGTVAFIRQTFYDAIRYGDELARYDRIKRGIPRPAHNKKLAALLVALRGDLPVLFVANSDGDIRRALSISDEFKLKPVIAGALYGYRVVDKLKAKNVPVILSVDFPRRPTDLPDDEDEPLRVLRERAEVPRGPAKLAQTGVKFAFTAGSLRPQDFLSNVQKAVENGLSKDDALRALTINAAEIMGARDQLGSIEVGKIANLVVISGDLLSRDARVRHVFIDGTEIDLRRQETAPQRGPGARRGEAPAVDPSGEWSIVVQSPQGDLPIKLTLRREGDNVTGSLSGPGGTTALERGSLEGNRVRCTATLDIGGQSATVVITGTVEGDSIRGSMSIGSFGTFDFTGSRPR